MLLVAVAWLYVVVLMAVVEATSSNGTVLGALFTLLLYGLLPLALVLYLLATPARRRARLAAEQANEASAPDPDRRGHAPADAVAPVREEP
jgi:membrane protein implicated in regulation of membrane protease activity